MPSACYSVAAAHIAEGTYELQEPFGLREYKNYGDVHFTEFFVPEATHYSEWVFVLLSNPAEKFSNCDTANATV